MSLEAWGDEGNIPSRWEDTAMRQEWDAMRVKFRKWVQNFHQDFANDETTELVGTIEGLMDRLEDEQMSGEL
jgi:hypothetical protein